MTLQTLGITRPSDVKKLKTMSDLSAVQLAFLQDIASGQITKTEGRPIQKELSALQRKWQKHANEARTPEEFEALKSIFGTDRR